MVLRDALRGGLGRDLREEDLDRLEALCNVKSFEGGDTVIRQFDQTSDIVVVLNGSAKVLGFNESTLREAGPGSTLGEVALLDEQPRSATVRAVGRSELAIIPSKNLRALFVTEPHIAATVYRNIGRALCSKLRQTTMELDGLSPLAMSNKR